MPPPHMDLRTCSDLKKLKHCKNLKNDLISANHHIGWNLGLKNLVLTYTFFSSMHHHQKVPQHLTPFGQPTTRRFSCVVS